MWLGSLLLTIINTVMTKDAETTPNLGKLEEDDEFEEFPVEDWKKEDTEAAELQVRGSSKE